jgi:formate/nitrite transporter FocA (FNT family)
MARSALAQGTKTGIAMIKWLRAGSKQRQTSETEDPAEGHERLESHIVYEIIRREGEIEIERPMSAIAWSGVAAGLVVSFSFITEAIFHAALPDAPWRGLVENLGYTVGFLMVILSRLQLFTENTITAVLPALANPNAKTIGGMGRLWGVSLLANLIGTALAAWIIVHGGILADDTLVAALSLAEKVGAMGFSETFMRALPAGFLIAALVWMLPSSEGNEVLVIVIVTYLIAAGDFAHVVVGSAELFALAFSGRGDLLNLVGMNLLPALLGNVVGGTGLFALLAWAQVRKEIEHDQHDEDAP